MKCNTYIKLVFLALIMLNSIRAFTQKKSGNPIVLPKQNLSGHSKTPNDTLHPGNLDNLVSPEYVLLPADDGGYVLGTNSWNDKCKCQQYKVTYNYHIEGAIYWFGYKRADSSGIVRFGIWNMDSLNGTTYDYNDSTIQTGQACPGTLFVAISDTTKNIDTSSDFNQAHIVMFPFPVLVTNDYCIGVDLSNIGYDSLALVSTNKGQGGKFQLVWEQWKTNQKWYTLQGAQWDGDTLDIDAMIFPIIDNTAGCVENGEFISGIKLSQSYPNPAPGICTISYEFATSQPSASIRILDIQGKQVYFTENLDKTQGVHSATIDVSNLANGSYFYMLSAGATHLAKKMTICK